MAAQGAAPLSNLQTTLRRLTSNGLSAPASNADIHSRATTSSPRHSASNKLLRIERAIYTF
jgi:hypothetical protein